MNTLTLAVRRLPHGKDLPLPAYGSAGAAGLDLMAAVDADLVLKPGKHAMVPTGIEIALPAGFEAEVRPRSGLALRHAVTVLNAPGTIDSDYRGEIGVILVNLGDTSFTVTRGMRIAQLVVGRISRVDWQETEILEDSDRGGNGFGSTGGIGS